MKFAASARAQLLSEIDADMHATRGMTGIDCLSARVRDALCDVDRAQFVSPELRERAWDNQPLPIGCGQTISQPFIVALMSEALGIEPDDVVLEIGTGCGYQTAVLARLARRVVSIERLPELAGSASTRLRELGVANVEVHAADGYYGWAARAPYRRIIVTAAAYARVPPPLLEQLAAGGRLVAPVQDPGAGQDLLLVERSSEGVLIERALLPVSFVPLTGGPWTH